MKYFIMLCDGMADEDIDILDNSTPMKKAYKPCMDSLAKKSEIGLCKTVQDEMKPGSDVANLAVLGYNAKEIYCGRSPLEAASIGIKLKDTDVTFRANLVSLSDDKEYKNKTMLDYSGGDISTNEARELVTYIQEKLGNDEFHFYSGVSYRHCLVWDNGKCIEDLLTPPHDIPNKCVKDYLPKGIYEEKLLPLMEKSYELLKNHPVNIERIKQGKKPANSLWFWGEGTKPSLENFTEKNHVKGSMISAVDLLKGIAILSGMNSVDVENATGYIDTNFKGKAEAAINEFKSGQDLVYVHCEAPDECGHRGEAENKIKSIEMIDELVLKPVVEFLRTYDDFKVLVCPDHPTPLCIRTHSRIPVPYMIYSSINEIDSNIDSFNEDTAKSTGIVIDPGYKIMKHFLSE